MSRLCLGFLRPYLCPAAWPRKPEHANAYLSVQRRLATTVAAEDYIGPHDVEKQKRIEQLKRVRPLDAYHPSLSHAAGVERLSLRDFNVKYHSIQETQNEVVSVLGCAPCACWAPSYCSSILNVISNACRPWSS